MSCLINRVGANGNSGATLPSVTSLEVCEVGALCSRSLKHVNCAGMRLREVNLDDAPAIAALHTASWRDAYRLIFDPAYLAGPVEQDRLNVWAERLSTPDVGRRTTLAEDGSRLVGFICTFGGNDATWGSLVDNLHVHPDAKGKGIGKQLLRSAAAWVTRAYPLGGMYLWVYEANEASCRFYDRMGGKSVERLFKSSLGGTAPILRYHWPDPKALDI